MRSVVDLKQKKLLDILRTIQIHGPVAKPDVAVMANISTVTAHTIMSELEAAGLIAEAGASRSNGGRKAALYRTNPEYGYIIGQNVGRTKITTSLCDLSLKTLYIERLKSDLTKANVSIANMKSEIDKAVKNAGVPKEKILGVGVTLPGQVNHQSGVVNGMLNMTGWNDTLLQSIIERSCGLPACVYNDNRANVVSCKWLDKIPEAANAVYVNISDGVGVGVMIRGEVFSGSHSLAGELGHIEARGNKTKCQCGGAGCVETLVCTEHIIRRVKKVYDLSASGKDSTRAQINEIIRAAKDGNAKVYGIIRDAVLDIGFVLDLVIKAYDPEKTIIYSPWLNNFDELFGELTESVFEKCGWLKKNSMSIERDTDDYIDSYGPVSIVLENLFNYESENRISLKLE